MAAVSTALIAVALTVSMTVVCHPPAATLADAHAEATDGTVQLSLSQIPDGNGTLVLRLKNISSRPIRLMKLEQTVDFTWRVIDAQGRPTERTAAGEQNFWAQTHCAEWMLSRSFPELAPGEDSASTLPVAALGSLYVMEPGRLYSLVVSPNRYPSSPDPRFNNGLAQETRSIDQLSVSLVLKWPRRSL